MAVALWTVAAASVRGRSHEHTGAPCQDSSAVLVSPNGSWVALAASDGAGTAKKAEIGADFFAQEFAKCLIRLSEDCDRRAPGAWVSDQVIQEMVVLRNQLRELAGSDDISDFHCTLTAALIGPRGGLTVHLGDGAIISGAAGAPTGDVIDLASDYFVSVPQNGEYANETVFVTERDWVKNLRIRPMTAVDWVVLGSDGGMTLAMVDETTPKTGFVVPVIRALIQERDFASRCAALKSILGDRQADKLTNDDKTLVAAIRSQYQEVKGEFGVEAKGRYQAAPGTPHEPPPNPFQDSAHANGAAPSVQPVPAFKGAAAARRARRYWGGSWLLFFGLGMPLAAILGVTVWFVVPMALGLDTTAVTVAVTPKTAPTPGAPGAAQGGEKPSGFHDRSIEHQQTSDLQTEDSHVLGNGQPATQQKSNEKPPSDVHQLKGIK